MTSTVDRARRSASTAPPAHRTHRQEPQPARLSPTDRVIDLQRRVGNRAVANMVRRPPAASVQRVKPGWSESDESGPAWNKGDHVVKGTHIHRVPVQGLKLGNQKDFASFGDERDMTSESAAGRAIVLFSSALKADEPVDVMLHFHGYDYRKGTDPHAGWRQSSDDHTVRDVDQDRIEQQMEAAESTQTVAVLPQGVGKSSFGDMPWNDYVREALGVVATMGFPQIEKAPKNFRLILSGHSAGGFSVTPALEYDEKHHKFSNEPTNLTEVVLFEALHNDAGAVVARWAEVHMERVRDADPGDRKATLKKCPRLRAYYSAGGSYAKKYERLKRRLDAWFDANADKVSGKTLAALRARFQVRVLDGTNHETVVRGLGDDPAAGPIADAIRAVDDPKADGLLDKGEATWSMPKPAKKLKAKDKPKATPKAKTAVKDAPQAVPKADDPAPADTTKPKKAKKKKVPGAIPDGAIRATRLGEAGDKIGGTEFRKLVYEKQLQLSVDAGKEFFPGLAQDDIGSVDGQPIRKEAEQDAVGLMKAAAAQLAADQKKRDPVALGCAAIGVGNAYRSLERDFTAWQKAYPKAFRRTKKQRDKLADGALSDAAAAVVAADMIKNKAIPGYSNHTRGLAIDFTTTQDGNDLTSDHDGDEIWKDAWFRRWLVANCKRFHFQVLDSEYWHFDHVSAPNGASPDTKHADLPKATGAGGGAPAPAAKADVKPAGTTKGKADADDERKKAPAKRAKADDDAKDGATTTTTKKKSKKKKQGAKKELVRLPALAADAEVTITWGEHTRKADVASSSLDTLREILRQAGIQRAEISSTRRTAGDQARVMYDNIVSHGVASQKDLYGAAGDQVVDTYVELKAQGLGAKDIKAGMQAKIEEIGPEKVSNHAADPKVLNVFDVGPNSLGGDDAVQSLTAAAKEAERDKRIKHYIPHPPDPGCHFEIVPH